MQSIWRFDHGILEHTVKGQANFQFGFVHESTIQIQIVRFDTTSHIRILHEVKVKDYRHF